MDRAGVRHLILQAIRPHVAAKISGLADTVAAVFATQRGQISQKLTQGMKRTWREPALADALVAIVRDQLAGNPVQRSLRSVMVFEAAENMSYATIGRQQVEAQLAPAAIRSLLDAAFTQAYQAAFNNGVVNLPYLNETGTAANINMSIGTIGVTDAQLGGTPALQTVADAAVGTPAPAGATPAGRVPPLGPPGTLLAQLGGLAAEWKGRGDLMQAQIATLSTKIQNNARQSFTAAPLAPLADNTVRGLYRALYARLQTISSETARATVMEFLDADIKAKVRDQVDAPGRQHQRGRRHAADGDPGRWHQPHAAAGARPGHHGRGADAARGDHEEGARAAAEGPGGGGRRAGAVHHQRLDGGLERGQLGARRLRQDDRERRQRRLHRAGPPCR